MEGKTWLWLVVLVVVICGFLVAWWLKERKVIAAKKQAAKKNGWTYRYLAPAMFFRYRKLPFIEYDAKGQLVKHVLTGEHRGRPVTMFTYRYTIDREEVTGSLGRKRTEERTKRRYRGVVVVGLPSKMPALEIAPRGAVSSWAREKGISVGKLLGEQAAELLGGSIDSGDEAFNQEFVIKSRDGDFARRILTPDVRAWMLQSDNAGKYTVVIKDDEIITWGTGTDVKIGMAKADHLNDLIERVPPEVLATPKA